MGASWWWVSMAEDSTVGGEFIGAAIVSAENREEAESVAAAIAKRRPEFVDFQAYELDAAGWLPDSEHRLRLLDEASCRALGTVEARFDEGRLVWVEGD